MKPRLIESMLILFLSLLVLSGCAYTLSYSVKTTRHGAGVVYAPRAGDRSAEDLTVEAGSRRFAVEQTRGEGAYGYSMEKKLLNILAQSLEDLGWSHVSETSDVPFYTFFVDFEQPEPGVYVGGEFNASTGVGSGLYLSTTRAGGGGYVYDPRFFGIRALPPGTSPTEVRREYTWFAEIMSDTTAGNIFDLARHAMPVAFELFPESGFRELREKVVPRRNASPYRR
jgi:hypothetical protein